MAKARQQYFADDITLQKESRDFAIQPEIIEKLESIEAGAQVNVVETIKVNGEALIPDEEKAVDVSVPLVEDTLYSTSTEKALSAKQGKVLYEYIQNLASRGRYLSNWNSTTGLPTTNPIDNPYTYRAGDYYVVSNIAAEGGTNYRPSGSSYTRNVASTTVESETVRVGDYYTYDGTQWLLLVNTSREIAIDSSLSPSSTNPVENRIVTNALNTKQNIITDLETIRSGAALGATAIQPGDSLSELSGTSDNITQGTTNLFMTTTERSKLSNQSGVNTGDETQTTIKNKLGQASTSTDGYLTSTDWNTFNNKQAAINDLATIRSNAQAGKSASDTIATYGDIVTHNASEFASASAEGDITQLQSDMTQAQSDITSLQGDMTQAQSDIVTNHNDIVSLDTRVDNLEDDMTQAQGDITSIQGDISTIQGQISDIGTGKQDKLIAGTNIQIAADGKTISATDTKYTAGPGIAISNNNVISNTQTSAEWGNITGTLSDQTDLQTALNNKQDKLTAGDNITIGEVCVDTSDMQGPAPDGFHVPLNTEWQGLKTIMDGLSLSDTNDWEINLHMPRSGERNKANGRPSRLTTPSVDYWSSSTDGLNCYAFGMYVNGVATGMATAGAEGCPIRCFKNEYATPTASWTVVQGTLGGAGIFWNQSEGLISITNGTTGYTIMDKNLGATQVWNYGDTFSEANCGGYFQRGNNYMFPFDGTVTTSSTKVDASSYGPGNYYESSTFITSDWERDSSYSRNLRGGVSQGSTQECNLTISAIVPDSAEWGNITGTLSNQTDLQAALNSKQNILTTQTAYTNKGTATKVPQITTNTLGQVTGITEVDITHPSQVSDIAYASSWDGVTTVAPSKNAVYDKLSAMDTTIAGKQATISDLATIRSGASKGATAVQPNDNISTLTNDAGFITSSDIPTLDTAMSSSSTKGVQNKVIKQYVDDQVQAATAGAVSDTVYGSSWDGITGIAPSKNAVYDKLSAMDTTIAGKQATISDLATIRSGASKGATAVQPGNNVSALTNDAGYITKAVNDLTNYYTKSETYTKAEVADYVANFAGFKVVATLPTTDIKTTVIYLLGPVGSGADKYEEYIYSNNAWVKIGDTSIDLSPYLNLNTQTSDDIDEGSINLFLTTAERTKLNNTSGTNTGDESKQTIQNKLGAATASNDGYLASADWSTFNNKQNALSSQTAYSAKGSATKVPQITTNSLGQVTSISEVTITQPTVNNPTITFTQNGTSVGDITLNQSGAETIALTDTTYTAGRNIDINNSVINTKLIEVTVSTAYNTAAKVGTTTAGNYTPVAGDLLLVNFVNGCSVASPTLNIDGSGAKNIRTGDANATTATLALGSTSSSNIKIIMYYDGTYYRTRSTTNNTYSAMSVSEGTTGTATSARTVRADYLKQIIEYYIAQSSSGGNVLAVTQAEYDALTPAEKADGKLRLISDAPAITVGNVSSSSVSSLVVSSSAPASGTPNSVITFVI